MQNLRRRNLILNTTQIVVWAGVFLVPALVTWTTTGHMQQAFFVFRHTARMVFPLFLLYGLNYYLLVPQFLYGGKGKVKWFYILNVLLLVGYNLYRFWPRGPITPPEEVVEQPYGADEGKCRLRPLRETVSRQGWQEILLPCLLHCGQIWRRPCLVKRWNGKRRTNPP